MIKLRCFYLNEQCVFVLFFSVPRVLSVFHYPWYMELCSSKFGEFSRFFGTFQLLERFVETRNSLLIQRNKWYSIFHISTCYTLAKPRWTSAVRNHRISSCWSSYFVTVVSLGSNHLSNDSWVTRISRMSENTVKLVKSVVVFNIYIYIYIIIIFYRWMIWLTFRVLQWWCTCKFPSLWLSMVYVYKLILLYVGSCYTYRIRGVTLPSLKDTRYWGAGRRIL